MFDFISTSLVTSNVYTEEELVRDLKLQDEQAFRYLYDHYSKAIFVIIFQIVRQQEIAEDLLQQTFLKIWKNISSYDPAKGRLFTWMLNIARNHSIDFTRSKEFNKSGQTVSLTESVYEQKSDAATIRDIGLKKILEKLPEEKRKLLELSFFNGYSHQEIAEMTGTPLGTVKTRLRAIIIELRKTLNVDI